MADSYFRSIKTPADRATWERLAACDPQTLIFQQPAWTDAIISTQKYADFSRLYETRDGRLLLLPMVRTHAFNPALSTVASMPDGWGMGGLISDQPILGDDAAHVLADLGTFPDFQVNLRVNPLNACLWDAGGDSSLQRVARETHILNLDGGYDTVWSKRFPSATRTKIRKAEKNGLEVVVGKGGEYLDSFYDLYMKWIDRRAVERKMPLPLARWLGKRREPLDKFQAAARVLGPAFQIWLAQLDGEPVAGAILLIGHHQAAYWRSASIKELAGPTRANDLLQHYMIQSACNAGCRYYHMGESGGVESLKQFKGKFGAEAYSFPGFTRERLPVHRARQMVGRLVRVFERRLIKE